MDRVPTFEIKSEKGRRKMELIFLRAVEQGNPKVVADCLSKGVDPNIEDEESCTALHVAARKGDLLVGSQLMNHPKTNLNVRSAAGYTPLMLACVYEQRDFARALLRKGVKKDLTSDKGQTALHMACMNGNTHLVSDLVAAGASTNIVDVFEHSPLSIAVTDHPSEATVRLLLKKGALITGLKQFPLLLQCVLNCNSEKRLHILKILLHHNEDINCLHPISMRNCLHYVAITGYLPAGEYLLTNGADLHQVDRSNRTPLEMALDHENFEVVKLFRKWLERKRKVTFSSTNVVQDVHNMDD